MDKNINVDFKEMEMHLNCLQKSTHFVPTCHFKHIDTGTNWPPFYIHHFEIYFLRCKFLYFIHISLNLLSRAPRGQMKNRPSVIHVMLWRPTGDNPLY